MRAKSISTPATSAATMIALSHVSWLSAFVGDTLLRTNSQKNLATKFNVAFQIHNRGAATHSAHTPSAAIGSERILVHGDRATESGNIGGVELSHNLLTISPRVSSHPITLVKVKNLVDVKNSVQAPHEDSALLCNKLGLLPFVISHIGIPINLPLALNRPSVWLAGH
ncbi:hypothetical protein H5410_045882 [Solanum commersonii]|uniref:Uncharacterized protein n=1 Tax=Solanum commersonii TaxID=4109 RepID=A0A9J5XEY0_SOLCO|nr:hypothetical protein H5410_045882 [Solanum commersonii]